MATSLTLTDVQEVRLSLNPLDREGNAATLASVPVWSSSDESIVTVTADADGMTATAATVGPEGSATVTVTASGDLDGSGDAELTDTVDIMVVGSEASALNMAAGTPTERPNA